jgi:hypothetical protein
MLHLSEGRSKNPQNTKYEYQQVELVKLCSANTNYDENAPSIASQ